VDGPLQFARYGDLVSHKSDNAPVLGFHVPLVLGGDTPTDSRDELDSF